MGQAADGQQRDDGAVMRQAVEAARGHGGNPVHKLQADSELLRQVSVGLAQGLQGDAHAARGGAGDARQDVHGHRERDHRIAGGDIQDGFANHGERRQRGDRGAIADLGGGVEDRQERSHRAVVHRSPSDP